ncbi:MAG: hypothetical protein QOD81_1507 [Solirubrobacteraceae bacterium]|nr:hypothetical protein [Solirubrobacteraceae bacterium]
MPDHPNVLEPTWDAERPDPPFSARAMRAGANAGAQELGATLYEPAPGGAVSPYHLHHANEELLIVLAGRPEVRTPAGRERLEPGAVVAFPRTVLTVTGPQGGKAFPGGSDVPLPDTVAGAMRTEAREG